MFNKCKKGEAPTETERRLKANNSTYNAQFKYAANYIKTSKYNMVTFLPKNLFEQFQRLANFYFLILMILQLIPQISSLTPLTTILPLVAVLTVTAMKDAVDDLCIPQVTSVPAWTTILPLAFVLLVSAVKEAFDDIQRHRSDNQVNNRKSYVVRQGKLVEEKWQNVSVGDIIRMESDNFVAADLLLLSSSEPYGICYIETAELDGETNLKARQSLEETFKIGDDLSQIGQFDGEVVCEAPNNRLNSFDGKLLWRNNTYALDNEKMLLRGCILRNTKWCFGLVVFAGRDTKLMMNSGKTTFKRTSLDRFLNVLIIGIVIFLLAMCFICTICCGIWEYVYGSDFQTFLPWDSFAQRNSKTASVAFIAFLIFFSYAILLNTVVPISLYVSVEIIRFYHSWWINWDQEMYYEYNDTPARARTTTLNEELGQIQYIFSDKTGTLTQNIMTFNKCSINGKLYGDVMDEKGQPMDSKNVKPLDFSWNKWSTPKFKFFDKRLVDDTKKGDEMVQMYWRLIALCHTVIPDYKDDKLLYQAQSPDEEALTMAARCFGFVFKSRTQKTITIEVFGKEETYTLLCILDFNNVRKRMSVLLEKDGKCLLFCKGADTMVFERLNKQSNTKLHALTQTHLDKFANEGLRTLCVAYKEIPKNYVDGWMKRQHAASIDLQNRQEKLDAVYEEIEKDLILLGATAIEDKLQDGVPETIANLADANIKIWVLTGDKQETAINIGYSCRLLTEDMREIFIIDGDKFNIVQEQLDKIKKQIDEITNSTNSASSPHKNLSDTAENGLVPVMVSSNQHAGSSGQIADSQEPLEGFALVINGHSLTHALDRKLEMTFLEIGCACKAVICCRVTPLQKALVVDLVKRNKKAVTLAVGDGANDVSMIKMAHIGVGISGQEGMQAVLASDYSIAQFRYLERLLLVHGRWSYYRMSKFLRYFFYKNFAFTLVHFWFSFYCAYSAQTIYDPLFIACYNLFFTALPVLALGIFDQDVNDKSSLKYPRLYIPGQYNLYFNMRIFVYSVFHGIFSSLVLFFIPMATLSENVMQKGLNLDGLLSMGFTIFSSLVVTVTAQIAIDTAYWTTANHIVIWGSLSFYFLVAILFYEAVPYAPFRQSGYGVAFMTMQTANYWFCILLIAVILIMPVIGLRFFWFDTQPTLSDRIRVKQNIRRLHSRMSELPLHPFRTASGRSRRGSTRSGYAFAHQQGFGDLITKGIVIQRLAPIRESPVKEQNEIDAEVVSVR